MHTSCFYKACRAVHAYEDNCLATVCQGQRMKANDLCIMKMIMRIKLRVKLHVDNGGCRKMKDRRSNRDIWKMLVNISFHDMKFVLECFSCIFSLIKLG